MLQGAMSSVTPHTQQPSAMLYMHAAHTFYAAVPRELPTASALYPAGKGTSQEQTADEEPTSLSTPSNLERSDGAGKKIVRK